MGKCKFHWGPSETASNQEPSGIRAWDDGIGPDQRTVLLSSHLMSEMQLVADRLVVIGRGRILADTSMQEFIEASSSGVVTVVTPDASTLATALAGDGVTITSREAGTLEVSGLEAAWIGEVAASNHLRLHELTPVRASLETAYLELTHHAVEYAGTDTPHNPNSRKAA